MSKKDKISLIMKCDHSSSSKLRMLWEQGGQKSSYPNSYFRIKIIQDQLWDVFCCYRMMLDVLLILDTSNFKDCQHSLQMTDKQFPTVGISQNHHMCEIEVLSIFVDLLQLHVSSWVKGDIVKHHHDFFEEVVNLNWWLQLGRNKNFNRCIILKDIIELIEHCLVIFLYKLFSSFLLVLNGYWFLPQLFRQFLPLFSFLYLDLIFDQATFEVNFLPFLLILNLIRLFFEGSSELEHTLWLLPYWLSLLLCCPQLLLVRFGFVCLFYHC